MTSVSQDNLLSTTFYLFPRKNCHFLLSTMRRRTFPSLLLLAATLTNNVVHSQSQQSEQHGDGDKAEQPEQPQTNQPLGNVLHTMFDKDKDQRVTLKEVEGQLGLLKMIFAGDEREGAAEYKRLITGFQTAAPSLFDLLDANGDKALTKEELLYASHFERAVEKVRTMLY